MNWYKRAKFIFASNRLKLPLEELLPQINKIASSIVNDYAFYKNKTMSKKYENLVYKEIYTSSVRNTNVFAYFNFSHPRYKNTFALYEKNINTLSIFPNTIDKYYNFGGKNNIDFRTEIIGSILHELSHNADPKLDESKNLWFVNKDVNENIRKKMEEGNIGPYLAFLPEIDAITQQIVHDIEMYAKSSEESKAVVNSWLKKPMEVISDPIKRVIRKNNIKAIEYWIGHNPKIIKMLKQRIYNAIQ